MQAPGGVGHFSTARIQPAVFFLGCAHRGPCDGVGCAPIEVRRYPGREVCTRPSNHTGEEGSLCRTKMFEFY